MNTGGRDKIWTQDAEKKNWGRIDAAVQAEVDAIGVARQFLPAHPGNPVGSVSTIPALIIDTETMIIDDSVMTSLIDIWVEFTLAEQQIENEEIVGTAATLARFAADALAQAEDILIFQGKSGVETLHDRKPRVEHRRSLHIRTGLLEAALTEKQIIDVPLLPGKQKRYGQNTFAAVAQAINALFGKGRGGPYAVALNHTKYAETYSSQDNTFVYAAEVIKPLATGGYFSTNALPDDFGVVVALGGTMERIAGVEPYTQYTQMDDDGFYHFRVYECFALNLMLGDAVFALHFQE
jgi:uncharacterized linocin/CFP29 family protein